MKQKMLITLCVVLILGLFGISTVLVLKTFTKSKVDNTPVKSETQQAIDDKVEELIKEDENLTEEEKEELTEEEKEGIVVGQEMGIKENVLLLGDANNKEYRKEGSDALYRELIKYAEKAGYLDILNRVDTLKQTYKFTEDYNWKICNVYLDANVMINVKNIAVDGQRGYMVSNLKDPYMLLISTLMLPEKERRSVIEDVSSLSPIFDGEVTIEETKIFTHENKEEELQAKIIMDKESSLKELYKINFKVEGNPLVAYICKYTNGALTFKTIIADGEYEHPYKPITYWMNLDSLIYGDGN